MEGIHHHWLSRISKLSLRTTKFRDRVELATRIDPTISEASRVRLIYPVLLKLFILFNYDIDAGKHDELLSELTNEDRMETLEALGSICNSIKCPFVQSVDINKSTSYAGVAGGSAKDQPNVNSNFRTLVADPYLMVLTSLFLVKLLKSSMCIDCGRKLVFALRCLIEVNSRLISWLLLLLVFPSLLRMILQETIRVEMNGGCPDVIHKTNVAIPNSGNEEEESAPQRRELLMWFTSQSSPMLKTTGNSSKKDNLSMSNSFSALNEEEEEDEEDVENVYDESANLIQNTKAGGSSSFTAAAG
ncbi:hypothetical protein Tco_1571239 [Tanacetum coccineum]